MTSDKKSTIRVMGFGTFDGIHPGHIHYFKQLQQLGDEVFVVVARDKNVKKIKGKKPQYSEQERFFMLERQMPIDKVILGDMNDFYQCLRDYRPDVIGLGYDQKANEDRIRELLPMGKLVRLNALEPSKYKTSLLSD